MIDPRTSDDYWSHCLEAWPEAYPEARTGRHRSGGRAGAAARTGRSAQGSGWAATIHIDGAARRAEGGRGHAGEIFWDVAPYVTLAIVVVGTWWRYRYDKFGWTTRSSRLYESRRLRIASPMFPLRILVV